MLSPMNPDFDDRTRLLQTVRRSNTFLTPIFDSHFFSLKSKNSQNSSVESIPSLDGDWRGHAGGRRIDDEVIRHRDVRFALNRSECFRIFDGGLRKQGMPGFEGYNPRLDVEAHIPLNSRCLSQRGIMNALDFQPQGVFRGLRSRNS